MYPRLTIRTGHIRHNAEAVRRICGESGIQVCGIVKGYAADPVIARAYYEGGVTQLGSARLHQLRRLKQELPGCSTLLIRIPMLSGLEDMVRWSDMSFQTERAVLAETERYAEAAGKTHEVLLVYDCGDLREGLRSKAELAELAAWVERSLPRVHLAGLATTFQCYADTKPTVPLLLDFLDAVDAVEQRIGRAVEIRSGGATYCVPLVTDGAMPKGVNHLRVGGLIANPWTMDRWEGYHLDDLRYDTFLMEAEVVEVDCKPYPGHPEPVPRAIVAMGRADIGSAETLFPLIPGIRVVGGSSDHSVLDLSGCAQPIRVGDVIPFRCTYFSLMHCFYSDEVERVALP